MSLYQSELLTQGDLTWNTEKWLDDGEIGEFEKCSLLTEGNIRKDGGSNPIKVRNVP